MASICDTSVSMPGVLGEDLLVSWCVELITFTGSKTVVGSGWCEVVDSLEGDLGLRVRNRSDGV